MAMDLDTRAALERLSAVAQGGSGQSQHVADLLLAWFNSCENGRATSPACGPSMTP